MSARKKTVKERRDSIKPEADKNVFICKVCKKKFKEFRLLDRHSITHASEQLFPCSGCRKSFYSSQHLIMHRKIHHGDKQFTCDICQKVFAKYGNLKKHMLTHDIGKPYVCDFCDMGFRNETTMIRHLRYHTGRKSSLLTNSNETPVRNAVRRKSIALQKRSISLDLSVHSDFISSSLSTCSHCKETFTSLEELDIHILLCHPTDFPLKSPLRKLMRRSVSLSPITY